MVLLKKWKEVTPVTTRTNGEIASLVDRPCVVRVGEYGENVEGGGGKKVNGDAIPNRFGWRFQRVRRLFGLACTTCNPVKNDLGSTKDLTYSYESFVKPQWPPT